MMSSPVESRARASVPQVAAAALEMVPFVQAQANWLGKGEAGLVMARGNTETDTANAKLEIAREIDRWKHTFGLAGLYAKNGGLTTALRWDTRWQTDCELTERWFGFGAARYEDDRFSGFDYQATLSADMGYRIVATDVTKLTAQAGLGYRRLREELLVRDALGRVVGRIR